jgi:hypothetical protein
VDRSCMGVNVNQYFIDTEVATGLEPDLQHRHAANRQQALGGIVG